ncbi:MULTISPECIES: hypothetical protein [unclassified Pseudomonas]|uniref:hypothetical protein n=1 Tax=Pseudomonas TaxID=286 RepID=UPI0024B33FFB|nr:MULTISPECIES: hypothetical protein [unclassified Pseudomonas]
MTALQGSNGADHARALTAEEYGPNTEIIKNAIPHWRIKASPECRIVHSGLLCA